MNLLEYHREFKIASDKVDSLSFADFTKAERLQFLNEATLRFIKNRYSPNNIYKSGFEEIQKRTEDLKALVKEQLSNTSIKEEEGDSFYKDFDYPLDYMFYLRSISIVTYNKKVNCVESEFTTSYPNTIQQIDDLNKVLFDPFSDLLNCFFINKFRVYYKEVNLEVDRVKFTYLKYPYVYKTTDSDSLVLELSEHTHKEIVGEAVLIAQSYIQDDKSIAIQQNLNSKIE